MDGDHRYCACFTFYEPYTPKQSNTRGSKNESLSDTSSVRTIPEGTPGISVNNEDLPLEAYVPKCLCLVSRVTYFDVLKVKQLLYYFMVEFLLIHQISLRQFLMICDHLQITVGPKLIHCNNDLSINMRQ
jgi:hypothetical protein